MCSGLKFKLQILIRMYLLLYLQNLHFEADEWSAMYRPITYNLVKSLSVKSNNTMDRLFFVDGQYGFFSHSLILLPTLTAGRMLANLRQARQPSTSVFILELKPTGYIYSGQTYPAQRFREKKEVAWPLACATPERLVCPASQNGERQLNQNLLKAIDMQNCDSLNQFLERKTLIVMNTLKEFNLWRKRKWDLTDQLPP